MRHKPFLLQRKCQADICFIKSQRSCCSKNDPKEQLGYPLILASAQDSFVRIGNLHREIGQKPFYGGPFSIPTRVLLDDTEGKVEPEICAILHALQAFRNPTAIVRAEIVCKFT